MNADALYHQFNRLRPARGTIKNEGTKLKPNQKCPCGSDKKYKKCCQQPLEQAARLRGSNIISEEDIKK